MTTPTPDDVLARARYWLDADGDGPASIEYGITCDLIRDLAAEVAALRTENRTLRLTMRTVRDIAADRAEKVAEIARLLDIDEDRRALTEGTPDTPTEQCAHTFPLPAWMGADQDDPCRCVGWLDAQGECSHRRYHPEVTS